VRAGRPPTAERARRWWAARPTLVTSVLVAANLAIYVWGLVRLSASGSLFSTRVGPVQADLGLFGPIIAEDDEWWRIITSGFVHFGLLHVGFNMFILYRLGGSLEPALGTVRYTLTYFACLIAGSAGALISSPNALTAGASGAVYGMMGVFVAAMWARRIPLMQTDIGGLLIINLLLTFVIPGISIGGHLGGLLAGLVCGAVLLRPSRRRNQGLWPDVLVPIVVGAASFAVALWAASQWRSRL
jgi:membrane associated rhomboid family serine protease